MSLAEALPKEIERVQEIIQEYEQVPGGRFAAGLMKQDIREAQEAMMNGDLVKMIRIYKELKGWEMG